MSDLRPSRVVIALFCMVALATQGQAGDILRGGVSASATRNNAARANAGADMAAQTQAAARDRLARTTQALKSVESMQNAARALAGSRGANLGMDPNHPGQRLPNVPDGLGVGGLEIIGAPTGAKAPTQSASSGGITVTVEQQQQQAILNWKTFNIGRNTTLNFDQSAGKSNARQWIAFNKISDPSGSPSQILGAIKAQGQVYVINQNGIIFGGRSQINVHTLVASSLPINDNLISRGLLDNPDQQFLFTALAQQAGTTMPAYTPPAPFTPDGRIGDVTVQAGAQLTSPTSAEKIGGRIMLVGANVNNAGTITTPDGQAILAAGLQVGVAAHPSTDPSLRGLDVFVGDVGSYAGDVANSGFINAPRASVMMTGRNVNQDGVIYSTTSVSLNGRIDLIASYNAVGNQGYSASNPNNGGAFAYKSTGVVELGPGSVTEILPEIWSAEQAVGTELALRSKVNMQGLAVHLAEGAMVLAPNASISLQAGRWAFASTASSKKSQFLYDGGQIYLGAGSFIDAAGTTNALALMTENILSIQLRGSELADSPLQRASALRAITLTLDARKSGTYNGRFWIGTPLGDATGFLGLIERSVGELTAAGGNVELLAGNSVVLQKGSAIDVSGGWIKYQGGLVKTTRVLYQGHLIDIADATPDRIYDGIYTGEFTKTHAKWGVSRTYTNPLAPTGAHYEPDYISGANGGSIAITAPSMALDGELKGQTVIGPRQLRTSAVLSTLPTPAALSLTFKSQESADPYYFNSPTPPRIVFQQNAGASSAPAFSLDSSGNPVALGADRTSLLVLSPELLTTSGFGKLSIDNSDGIIQVPSEIELDAGPGGAITFTAANIDIQGRITAPGGSISLTAYNVSPYLTAKLKATPGSVTPAINPGRGAISLGSSAVLSATGLIVDDRPISVTPWDRAITTDGGAISLTAFSVDLQEGSVIDVSGGVMMSAKGKKAYGDGGSISILSGQDPTLLSVFGGDLHLGAELRGYSGAIGGSLTLQTNLVQVGGAAASEGALLIAPEFFNKGGFSSFTLKGIGAATGAAGEYIPGVVIAPGTILEPASESVIAVNQGGNRGLGFQTISKPLGSRAPVSLHFAAMGVRDTFSDALLVRGDLVMGEGSVIRTDPLASVSLSGNTVAVLGSIYAPAGSIAISGGLDSTKLFADQLNALPTVFISSRSVLSAAGVPLYTPDPYGRLRGDVLPGGTISISGNIVAMAGSVLDVSGASGMLDLTPAELGQAVVVPSPRSGLTSPLSSLSTTRTRVDSDGGTIILKGGQELFVDSTLKGAGGGPSAVGGSLIVSSGRFFPEGTTATPLDYNLVVTQNGGKPLTSSFFSGRETAIGQVVRDGNGNPIPAMGYFSVDSFTSGGFDNLALNGVVKFTGPVSIDARGYIMVADGGVIYADSPVNLTAAYVKLGLPFVQPTPTAEQTSPFVLGTQPYHFLPTYGPGSLTVKARLIDIGTLSLQGIGRASFLADNGEIRGDGTLDVAGDIFMRAAQIYPVTGATFTIAASDYQVGGVTTPGSVTFASSGVLPLPLSAGGQLNVYGSIINQGGVLRAPFGGITLGWDGVGTAPTGLVTGQSVATTSQLTLSRGSITSVSAIDPITGEGVLIPYGINVDDTKWIDPAGNDITAGGLPVKSIRVSAANIDIDAGSLLDIRGGGDLYAYRWVSGNGGSTDILASNTSFAVIPGYLADYAPVGAYNSTTASASNLGGDLGYVNSSLEIGDRVYLGASAGLPAGVYTLLPARYALMPGAFLVTPQSASAAGAVLRADGSSLVSGYRFNGLNNQRTLPVLHTAFEVASSSVVRERAQYVDYFANSYLQQSALSLGLKVPRLPIDAGHLVLQSTQSMTLLGDVMASGGLGGRGGMVDIASNADILISGFGLAAGPDVIVLDATHLSGFGAESLLIGGVREVGSTGATVTVRTGNLTVDNYGAPLSAPEIILASKGSLNLAPGAQVVQSGEMQGSADNLLIGTSGVAGSGDGTLLRVTSDLAARVIRTGVSTSTTPGMVIGTQALISGHSVTLDSTASTSLSPNAIIEADALFLNSGRISLQLDNPGALQPNAGLVLAGTVLDGIRNTDSLSLLSYSTIDIYGTGSFVMAGDLALHAAEIRGFNNGGGTVSFTADTLTLDNSAGGAAVGAVAALEGTLEFNSEKIRLGANQLNIDQYANLSLNAPGGIFVHGSGGLATQGNLVATTAYIASEDQSTQSITAGGSLILQSPINPAPSVAGALGGSLTLQGANVIVTSDILLPSGLLTVHATAGDLYIGGTLDVAGTAQDFYDVTKYTSGGDIRLTADNGWVLAGLGSVINVGAQAGGGDAGSLTISAKTASAILDGSLVGAGGAGGKNGSFSLDVNGLADFGSLNSLLNTASFTESRSIRVRSGDVLVDGLARARMFNLSADNGSITVAGTIDASGVTGGSIGLSANGSVTLLNGSLLTVAAQDFSNAGKGGEVSLEAGTQKDGSSSATAVLDIQAGSTIDLSVASNTPASQSVGRFTGVLHLRAPQTAGNTDLQINAINGNILDASSIVAEGYKIYDLTASGGAITTAVQNSIKANGNLFAGNTAAITARLLANNAGLDSMLVVAPGAEIINRTGNLTLGAANSTETSDWDLSTFRFGPKSAPGVLTLRAAGDIVFYNALSDGFVANPNNPSSALYNYVLMDQNTLLPVNAQSWSYRIVAGSDLSAANFQSINSAGTGSVKLGKDNGQNASNSNGTNNAAGTNAQTSLALRDRYQVIRTGSGDISIVAANDVQLLNQFASIYTAGTKVTDETMGGTFDVPIVDLENGGDLGRVQQSPSYPVQYSTAGGNVSITAGHDITHLTLKNGVLVADSGRELPVNWLYRRGYVDPVTGKFGYAPTGDVASTTWWVDFSNFFEGVGALGGGNVTLTAGNDVSNVDAVAPTNARMSGKDANGNPISGDAANLLELGGGDVVVRAGHDIDGGVYYVERGKGTLSAGNVIRTNSTRSPSLTNLNNSAALASQTWLPTTLFLGKGVFDVSARGDVLLGPVANPFLLPSGINNSFWYKTYFSTYSADSAVNVSSLGGSVTLRESANISDSTTTDTPILLAWLQKELLFQPTASASNRSASYYQPWLRLNETSVAPFSKVATLMPASFRATSFSSDINIVGDATLTPSSQGTLELLASGAINGLQQNGVATVNGKSFATWRASSINLSDANPNNIPGVASPYANQAYLVANGLNATAAGTARTTRALILQNLNKLFAETGATDGVLETKQALHAPGVLHAGDTSPARLYARNGNISGLTFYSPKFAQVFAGQDITDIALYLQNVSANDVSVVSSGRDILAYNDNSPLRARARAAGNLLMSSQSSVAGDIQISGPGVLEVLAGRNLDLGTGDNNADGTGVGITSVGNARNPYLSSTGADIIVGAGIGAATGLSGSSLDFDGFISQLGDDDISRYLSELGLTTAGSFDSLPAEQRDRLALKIFYLVLRDAGRQYSLPDSPGYQNYDSGLRAIAALFGKQQQQGDINTRARDIRTKSGGDINIFIPGGGLTLATTEDESSLAPPGIVTESGGNISIFARDSVNIGISRIFTLRGGNEIIWSSQGDIAAGSSAKTVKSAAPTRVLIDPQSADVQTDLAGLATGGGIGVLATVAGVPPGDVDLIAPEGTVDAGDAGIRVSGNLNIAAVSVLNASNISVGGASSGVPTAPTAAAPNIAGLTSAASANAGANAAANTMAQQARPTPTPEEEASIYSADVVGYGEYTE